MLPTRANLIVVVMLIALAVAGCNAPQAAVAVATSAAPFPAVTYIAPTATTTPTPANSPTPSATPPPTAIPTPISGWFPYPAGAPFWPFLPYDTPCGYRGTLFQHEFPSPVGGPTRLMHVYLPPCYGQDGRAYPVLYLLPGSVQTDSHWADLGIHHWLDALIARGEVPPVIVIMPAAGDLGNNTSGGSLSLEAVITDTVVPYTELHFCAWRNRNGRAIGGISRGGYWAMMLAFRHTDLFSVAASHSGQFELDVDDARYNPLVTYASADLSDMRLWLDWGDADFLQAGQQTLSDRLTAASIDHETHVFEGRHNERYWADHLRDYLYWYTAGWSLDRADYPYCIRDDD